MHVANNRIRWWILFWCTQRWMHRMEITFHQSVQRLRPGRRRRPAYYVVRFVANTIIWRNRNFGIDCRRLNFPAAESLLDLILRSVYLNHLCISGTIALYTAVVVKASFTSVTTSGRQHCNSNPCALFRLINLAARSTRTLLTKFGYWIVTQCALHCMKSLMIVTYSSFSFFSFTAN